MNKVFAFGLIIMLNIVSCDTDEEDLEGKFQFINEYSTTITVGGVVGITERTFKIGEVYNGTDDGGETIKIRIAEHTELNEDCPNSWCYQEFLQVPREFLKRLQ